MFEDEKEGKLAEIKKKLEVAEKVERETDGKAPNEANIDTAAAKTVDGVLQESPAKSSEEAVESKKIEDPVKSKNAHNPDKVQSPIAAAKIPDAAKVSVETKTVANVPEEPPKAAPAKAQKPDTSKSKITTASSVKPIADEKATSVDDSKHDSDDATISDDSDSGEKNAKMKDAKAPEVLKTVSAALAAASPAADAPTFSPSGITPPVLASPIASPSVTGGVIPTPKLQKAAPPVSVPTVTSPSVATPPVAATPAEKNLVDKSPIIAVPADAPPDVVAVAPSATAITVPIPPIATPKPMVVVAPVVGMPVVAPIVAPVIDLMNTPESVSDSFLVPNPLLNSPLLKNTPGSHAVNQLESDSKMQQDTSEVSKESVSKKRKYDDEDDDPVTVVEAPSKRSRTIELRDPVTGKVEQVFPNATDAADATSITRYKINKACQDGGGLVGGKFFRYQHAMDEDEFDGQASGNTDTAMPDQSAIDAANNASELAKMGTSPQKLAIQHALLAVGKQKARSLPMAAGRSSSTKVASRKMTPAPPLGLPKPTQFDLSTLKAVRKKTNPAKRPKRIIELVELRTGKVLVCFRGATDVCRALDLDRKDVTKACDAEEKRRKMINFKSGTFTLRYARVGKVEAYVYGDHREDYVKKGKTETHKEVAKRFKSVYAAEKLAGTLGELPDFLSGEKSTDPTPSVKMPALAALAAASSTVAPARSDFGELVEEGTVSEEKVDIVTVTAGLDATSLCLVCQTVPPHIVFEPCFHAVLCASCAGLACRSFCPLCRTPIQNRIEPKTAILVRPRIFSAYSFM